MFSVRICDGLDINDGNVDVGLSVEGTIANYTCDDGYRLVGAASRLCQNDGEWTDRAPVCQGMWHGVTVLGGI